MQSILLSIIIPVFNAKKYLHKCLESIVSNIEENIEIIIINDGSTDGSLEICDELSHKDVRIKVIHIENNGVSNARNIGINNASGRYLSFVDADDWINITSLFDSLTRLLSANVEIGVYAHYIFDGKNTIKVNSPWANEERMDSTRIVEELIPLYLSPVRIDSKLAMIHGAVWKCIFKTSFIRSKMILFNNYLCYTEDLVFLVGSLLKAENIIVSNDAFYYYRNEINANYSTTQNFVKNIYENLKLSQNILYAEIDKHNKLDKLRKSIESRNCMNLIFGVFNICTPNSPYSFISKIKCTNQTKRETSFNRSLDLVGYKNFKIEHKILLWLARNNLTTAIILIYLIRNKYRRFMEYFKTNQFKHNGTH